MYILDYSMMQLKSHKLMTMLISMHLLRIFWRNLLSCSMTLIKKSIFIRLIIKLSFELTFWTWINIKSSCSHFQLNLSRVAHIFNLTRLDSTENWVNSIQLIKNLSLTSRELNIEIFPIFCFCITFLHYLFDKESWRQTWRLYDRKLWREVMIESHDRELWRENMKIVWWKVMKRNYEEES